MRGCSPHLLSSRRVGQLWAVEWIADRPRTPRCCSHSVCQQLAQWWTPHLNCLCGKGILILLHNSSLQVVIYFLKVPFFTLCPYSTIGYQSHLGHQCVNTVHLIKSRTCILKILKSSNYTFFIKLYFFSSLIKILNIQLRKQEVIYVSLTQKHSLVSNVI